MLKKIEDSQLDQLNQKGLSDLNVLHQVFKINQTMQQSDSERIRNYAQNYYNDLKVFVLRRDFIDLYPKFSMIEKGWLDDFKSASSTALHLKDSQIESSLSTKHNKTVEDFQKAMQQLGIISGIADLSSIEKNKVSQNEFVNQKTVYNLMFATALKENAHLVSFSIIEDQPIASNDILNTKNLKAEKIWRPTI